MLSVRSLDAFLAADKQLLMTGGSWFGKGTAEERLPARRIKMAASLSVDYRQDPRDTALSLLKNTPIAIASSGVVIVSVD